MDAIERIDILLKLESLSRRELADMTFTKQDRWNNVLKRNSKLYQEDMETLYKLFPEYKYWLATGDEMLEAGQISPMTKKSQESKD
jgi:hypothetical protein